MNPYYEKHVKIVKGPIKKALKQGYKKEEIEGKLKDKRWPPEIISESFKIVFQEVESGKRRIIFSSLYWLGLAIAISSFLFRQYFLPLIAIGILLMLLSVPMRMADRKLLELTKKQKPGQIIALVKPEIHKSIPYSPIVPKSVKKESFFSRLFKSKPKEEKKKEEKQKEVKPELKPKELKEKALVVSKNIQPKSPGLALLLAIFPGFGHFYLGKTKKGFIFLLTFWLIIPWIYSLVDAYKLAKEINRKVRPPTSEEMAKKDLEQKEKDKKKPKKKSKAGLIILLMFSLAGLGSVTYLWMNSPGFTQLNAITYYTIVVLLTLILFPIIKKSGKKEKKKEDEEEKVKKVELDQLRKEVSKKQEDNETDFDKLHKMVEKYGRIKISDVAETFKITKQEAEEWASILEQHGLATIYYPAIGGPEIVRMKKKKSEEEE